MDEQQESQTLHFSANTVTKKRKQEKDHPDDIPKDDSIPLTDDDDKYTSETSEARSVDTADKTVNNNPHNAIIPTELISHFRPY